MDDDEFLPRVGSRHPYPWRSTPPDVKRMTAMEEFYFIRGGNFNRPIMVRCNAGVNSQIISAEMVDGRLVCDKREYWPEINVNFLCENMPPHIWLSEFHRYNLQNCEWAGPILPPEE